MIKHIANLITEKKGAYLVGGAVRDLILKRTPSDYDIAVPGNPKSTAAQIAGALRGTLVEMGRPGQQIFRVVAGPLILDISEIHNRNIEDDLWNRDFTINALALSLETGQVIDPVGGRSDIESRQIRMVSRQAFARDPVRLLRTYRFGAGLGFTIEPHTISAVRSCARRIHQSAPERLRAELFKMFESPEASPYLVQMAETGLLFYVIPELILLKGCTQNRYHDFDVLEHTLAAFNRMERVIGSFREILPEVADEISACIHQAPPSLLKFCILLHDTGKPSVKTVDEGGGIHFYDHDRAGAEISETVTRRLRCSARDIRRIRFVIENHLRPLYLFTAHRKGTLTRRGITRFFMKCGTETPLLMLHALADNYGKKGFTDRKMVEFRKFVQDVLHDFFREFRPRHKSRPLITGDDLIREFNLSPSPQFREILAFVEEERMANPRLDRRKALDMVTDFLRQK